MTRDSILIAEAYYGKQINESNHMQGVRLTSDTTIKTLISQILNDPGKLWVLLQKTPSLMQAAATGNVEKLQSIFLTLGVDARQIADVVQKSLELVDQDNKRSGSVPVRRAIPVTPTR